MRAKTKPPRERAARALCRLAGVPENTRFEGRPIWESYLPEVDAVLGEVLGSDEVKRMVDGEDRTRFPSIRD